MLAAATTGLASGHNDLADILFLVAFILAVIVFVLRLMAKAIDGMLMAAAVACLALAWFLL